MASKNFSQSVVLVGPSPASSGLSLTVATGHGSRFGPGPLVLWPAGEATPDNAELVTVQSVSGDVLTLSARAAESSIARAVTAGWQAAQGLTAGSWDQVASQTSANTTAIADLTTGAARRAGGNTWTGTQDFSGSTLVGLPSGPGGAPADGSITSAKLATDVVGTIAGKANTADVNAGLAGKANTVDVSTALAGKAANDLSNVTPVTARAALGLGTASTRGVGTSSGTVAAGDDSRIVGAAQATDVAASFAALPQTFASPLRATTAKTSAYTAVVSELVKVDATAGAVTITAPPNPSTGQTFAVVKVDATSNAVTVIDGGSKTFNGDPSTVIVAQWSGAVFAYDGSAWIIQSVMSSASSSAVTTVAGQSGAVTGAQIFADNSFAAALAGFVANAITAGDYDGGIF